jgi:hypothetical protein
MSGSSPQKGPQGATYCFFLELVTHEIIEEGTTIDHPSGLA